MAGIGFELVKLLKKDSYRGLLNAYGLTAFIVVGPGLFIIFSLGIICFFTLFSTPTTDTIREFLSIVIYLFSGSMIISSFLQYTFFRFVADLIFLRKFALITPNFLGVLLVQSIGSLIFVLSIVAYFFSDYSIIIKTLCIANFLILSMVWISTVLLTGFKSYHRIIWAFVLGYTTMIIIHFIFEQKQNDVTFLLFEFLLAQIVLFSFLLHAIIDFYPTNQLISFDFLKKENFYYTLVFSNLFYTLGFWVDKFLFWSNHHTGYSTFPPLSSSPIYDLPMFVALLTMIPGIAVFMLEMESKFAVIYPKVMESIFKRKPLVEINAMCNDLVLSGREAIFSLISTQVVVVIIVFLSAAYLFSIFAILPIYFNLLFILTISASLNVLLWALLSLLYYMTCYRQALYVGLVFVISNFAFTLGSFYAGPQYYGYGFALSLLLSSVLALIFLNDNFKNFLYTTFMMTD